MGYLVVSRLESPGIYRYRASGPAQKEGAVIPPGHTMKVKEESENVDLKLNIQKTNIMASGPISSVQFSSVAQSRTNLFDPMNHCT